MMVLNEAQLRFEALARQLEESGLFKDLNSITRRLRTVEKYLGDKVLEKWERSGGKIWEGSDASVLGPLTLEEFIGDKNHFHDFEREVSTPLDKLTDTLHDQLFGVPTRAQGDTGRG